jgi:hypothetical protein
MSARKAMSHAERWRAERAAIAAIPEAGPCVLCGKDLDGPADERPAPDHYSGPTMVAMTPDEHERQHQDADLSNLRWGDSTDPQPSIPPSEVRARLRPSTTHPEKEDRQ